MYAKSGSINNVRELFDKMPQRDVVLWNAMIAGYDWVHVQIQNVSLLIVVFLASAAGSQVHPDPIDLVPTLEKNYGIGFEKVEKIGFGLLPSPEDLAVDREKKSFLTGCGDDWIKRVWIDGKGDKQRVENWEFVGGRPLGVALGPNQELIVCELTQ
ncbi:hypothetical protein KI387_043254, partial [Taxus chinensis]